MRQRYEALMAHPEQIEEILQKGAKRARVYASELLEQLRHAVGLRTFKKIDSTNPVKNKAKKTQVVFKQYREKDGLFYFKLTKDGKELLISKAFESGRDAGQWIGKLKAEPALINQAPVIFNDDVTPTEVQEALISLAEA